MSKFNINQYLNSVIKHYEVSSQSGAYKQKRDQLEKAIVAKFKGKIYPIILSGSFKKNTAISSNYDMDLIIPFQHNSTQSLATIYNEVYTFLNREYRTNDATLKASPRKQKVSIGLTFEVKGGRKLHIDIIPAKKVHAASGNNDLALYVNTGFGKLRTGQEIHTNVKAQISHVQNQPQAKNVIKLLKVWKYQRFTAAKSFLIELLVIEAYKNKTIQSTKKGIWSDLEMAMKYIENHITHISFKKFGQDVADTLTQKDKQLLKTRMQRIRKEINEAQEQDLSTVVKKYFPKN